VLLYKFITRPSLEKKQSTYIYILHREVKQATLNFSEASYHTNTSIFCFRQKLDLSLELSYINPVQNFNFFSATFKQDFKTTFSGDES